MLQLEISPILLGGSLPEAFKHLSFNPSDELVKQKLAAFLPTSLVKFVINSGKARAVWMCKPDPSLHNEADLTLLRL